MQLNITFQGATQSIKPAQNFSAFKKQMRQLYKNLRNKAWDLFYNDDGDQISVEEEEEYESMLQTLQNSRTNLDCQIKFKTENQLNQSRLQDDQNLSKSSQAVESVQSEDNDSSKQDQNDHKLPPQNELDTSNLAPSVAQSEIEGQKSNFDKGPEKVEPPPKKEQPKVQQKKEVQKKEKVESSGHEISSDQKEKELPIESGKKEKEPPKNDKKSKPKADPKPKGKKEEAVPYAEDSMDNEAARIKLKEEASSIGESTNEFNIRDEKPENVIKKNQAILLKDRQKQQKVIKKNEEKPYQVIKKNEAMLVKDGQSEQEIEDQPDCFEHRRKEEVISSPKKTVNGSKTQSGRKDFSKNNVQGASNIELSQMMNGLESIESHPQEQIFSLDPSSVKSENQQIMVPRMQWLRLRAIEKEYKHLKERQEDRKTNRSGLKSASIIEKCAFCSCEDNLSSIPLFDSLLICFNCNEKFEIKVRVNPYRSHSSSTSSKEWNLLSEKP